MLKRTHDPVIRIPQARPLGTVFVILLILLLLLVLLLLLLLLLLVLLLIFLTFFFLAGVTETENVTVIHTLSTSCFISFSCNADFTLFRA